MKLNAHLRIVHRPRVILDVLSQHALGQFAFLSAVGCSPYNLRGLYTRRLASLLQAEEAGKVVRLAVPNCALRMRH
jgi:hypothetical protein